MRPQAEIGIGELARQSQCHVETIRYYERIGLLPRPRRNAGRYRRYDAGDIGRLRFVRRARQLGFTLDEVRALLRLASGNAGDVRGQARGLAAAHLARVRAKIADLQAMERVLTAALRECDAGQRPNCPLIEVLSGEPLSAPAEAPDIA